ncbi:MAG: TetR/AcrR family transcriptional regulator [Bacteroidota bacterium]
MDKASKSHIWIQAGYQTFALEGPQGLKVERLAKQVQKNKSSFYHYFADLDIFTEFLLNHHLQQAQMLAVEEAKCTSLDELIDRIVAYKFNLLFNRQLRVHREIPAFQQCFEKTNELTAQAIMGMWAKMLGLHDNSYLAALVLKLGIENFYLQITQENLNHEWLHQYFSSFRTLVNEFKNAKNLSALCNYNASR